MNAEKPVENTQEVPANPVDNMAEAAEAMFNFLDAEEAQPEVVTEQPEEDQDSQPVEDEEDTSEEQGEYEESEDEEYEPEDNREPEGNEEEVYTVTVNGEDIEVSLDELRNGYSRQADYTRKTQEISEERKKYEQASELMMQELQQTQAARQQYINTIGQFVNQGMANLKKYAGIDWARLKEEDPIEYVTKRDEFREEQEKIRQAHAIQQQAAQQQSQEFERMKADLINKETEKLRAAVPEWSSNEKRTELAGKLRTYATGMGYQKEEIDNLVDSRSVQVLLKAMKYDELMSAKPKKLKSKSKVVRPGSPKGKSTVSREKRAAKMNSLKQTGDVRTAASLIEDLL